MMTAETPHAHSRLSYLLMFVAIALTVVFAVLAIRNLPPELHESTAKNDSTATHQRTAAGSRGTIGVHATLTGGGQTDIARSLPRLSFSLAKDQSLDARLPAGPFEMDAEVAFTSGVVRTARVGAQLQNARLTILRGGDVILEANAGDEPQQFLSAVPIALAGSRNFLTYRLEVSEARPTVLRAIWQPDDALVAHPLPSEGELLLASAELRGMAIAQRYGCASCHQSRDASFQVMLDPDDGPDLSAIGARARSSWLRKWLHAPHAIKPGTTMPAFPNAMLSDDDIEAIVHFLIQRGGPMRNADAQPHDESLVTTGLVTYHRVGCVACHGPLAAPDEIPGGLGATAGAKPLRHYEPLGDLAAKTDHAHLAAFLKDPLATRPSGRMPDMLLSDLEADAIAAYLIDRSRYPGSPSRPSETASPIDDFTIEPQMAHRGRELFASTGCANCHAIEEDGARITSSLTAPALESLVEHSDAGCLADSPPNNAPNFALTIRERHDVRAFLAGMSQRRSHDVPLDRLALDIERFNCTACHSYFAERGPEAAIFGYFQTNGEADLGDEGRFPPPLGDAGGRLRGSWLHAVINDDERARPYIATRMPHFGEGARDFPALLEQVAGATALLDEEPLFSIDLASSGRTIMGGRSLNCAQCHSIAGHEATGTPGPDLALMPGRLRYSYFSRWLHDPKRITPTTRMPTFFVDGHSAVVDVLDGEAEPQIAAMWNYLSQGEGLALPEGMIAPGGFELTVTNEPIVLRTFMSSAGVRAIACGFPQQIHCAFDADRCELVAAWEGHFLNASGAWASRGGSETNPDSLAWHSPPPEYSLMSLPGVSGKGDEVSTQRTFRGYELDDERRPIFHYTLTRDETVIEIADQPLPRRTSDGAMILRKITLTGDPGAQVELHPGDLRVSGPRIAPTENDETRMISLDERGRAMIEVEVTW